MQPKELKTIGKDVIEPFTPVKILDLDDYKISLVRFGGEYRKHKHDKDEFFHVVEGDLKIKMEREGKEQEVNLKEGDVFVVPKNTIHKTSSKNKALILLIEHKNVKYEFLEK